MSRLEVMNYLNDAAKDFPGCISFSAGRPTDKFFTIQDATKGISIFVDALAEEKGATAASIAHLVAQYGPTGGIVNRCIAQQLANDEGILCDAADLLVTCGAQEAMHLIIPEICREPGDILIVRNPTYIGITGVADTHGVEMYSLPPSVPEGIPDSLAESILEIRQQGKLPRALYLIPDFDNPSGQTISLLDRRKILDLCSREGVVVIEDSPYRMFRFEGEDIPSFRILDGTSNNVIHIGTYSKTLCPALRVGYALLPNAGVACSPSLRIQVERRKSYASLNTSQLMQAAVGGILIADGFTLSRRVAPARNFYHNARDNLIDHLTLSLPRESILEADGGFFLNVRLPASFGTDEMLVCARKYGVIAMPASFFSFDHSCDKTVRFAYSNLDPLDLKEGAERFNRFVRDMTK